jgi:hypothetical protein
MINIETVNDINIPVGEECLSHIPTLSNTVINLLITPTRVKVVADTIPLQSQPVYLRVHVKEYQKFIMS